MERTDELALGEEEVELFEKIKGDAIGDTVYSERYVLRILIDLSNLTDDKWDEDAEQSLCTLWDMTADKDVANFLVAQEFFDIFCKVIRTVNNARCLEIVVGVLGNMCCCEDISRALAEHPAALVVLNMITSEDSLVLVQVLRLLNSSLWKLRENDALCTRPNSPAEALKDESNVREETAETSNNCTINTSPWLDVIEPHKDLIMNHLVFFLSSAINEELLCLTLEALDTLLAIPRLKLAENFSKSEEIAGGVCECLRQLLRGVRTGDSVHSNKRLWRAINVWLGIVGHIASCQEGRQNLGASGDILTKCFTKLVILQTSPEALKTQEPEMAVLCLCVLETLPTTQVTANTLARLTVVLYDLNNDIRDTEEYVEVNSLLHRGIQFLKKQLEESYEMVSCLQILQSSHHDFLLTVFQDDEELFDKLNRAFLQIRTNGLVQ